MPLPSAAEQIGDDPVTMAREVVVVRAQVLLGATAERVAGVATAWTSKAVNVRWLTDSDVHSAWA